jgi:DNA-directed RNA polymerase beta subunit
MTYSATLSHLRRVIIPIGKEGKNTAIRQIHSSSYGFICPCETPEGAKIGIVLNLSLTCKSSKKISIINVKRVLEECKNIEFIENFNISKIKNYTPIFLNGSIIGYTQDQNSTVDELKLLRNRNIIDREVSISYDSIDDEIRIFTDEGRFIRPLLSLTNNKLNIEPSNEYKWNDLIKNDLIRYIDAAEIENSVISMYPDNLNSQYNDYCEIHPCVMLGIMASQIPFPDHSQSPRNCYQCLWKEETVLMASGDYKRIADIEIGDKIITVDPITCIKSITSVINQYVRKTDKKIVKIITISGRELVCTIDHPILTNNGWVKAEDSKNKLIAVFPNENKNILLHEFITCKLNKKYVDKYKPYIDRWMNKKRKILNNILMITNPSDIKIVS